MGFLNQDQKREQFKNACRAFEALVDCLDEEVQFVLVGRIRHFGAAILPHPLSEWIDYCARSGDFRERAKAECAKSAPVEVHAEARK